MLEMSIQGVVSMQAVGGMRWAREKAECGEKRTQDELRRLSRYKALMERNEPQKEKEPAGR